MLIGKNITQAGEVLQEVPVERIYRALINTESEVATMVNRLRALRAIDAGQYRKLKTGLPYLVCAQFHPKIRKKENFLYTDRFFVDIDHISEFELDLDKLKEKFKADPRVELIYTSPSADGLKLLFVLEENINDSGYYSLFYKDFCIKLAQQYELGAAIDIKTNDVSRCCFVSHDPEAFYRADAEKINPYHYLPQNEIEAFDQLNANIREIEKKHEEQKKELGIEKDLQPELDADILNKIKEKVGVRVRKPKEKTYIQPEELDEIIPQIVGRLDGLGVKLLKMAPISYGRQLRVGTAAIWAEINIFYGQKGLSIVGTTKTGSNIELGQQLETLLKDYFQI